MNIHLSYSLILPMRVKIILLYKEYMFMCM